MAGGETLSALIYCEIESGIVPGPANPTSLLLAGKRTNCNLHFATFRGNQDMDTDEVCLEFPDDIIITLGFPRHIADCNSFYVVRRTVESKTALDYFWTRTENGHI